jgi:SnoaL-like domain
MGAMDSGSEATGTETAGTTAPDSLAAGNPAGTRIYGAVPLARVWTAVLFGYLALGATLAFARRWVRAWNDRDVEAVLSHFAEDAVFSSPLADRVVPGSGGVICGKEALRRYWTEALRHNPGLHFELLGVYFGVDLLVIRFRNQEGIDRCEILTFSGGLVRTGHGTFAVDG